MAKRQQVFEGPYMNIDFPDYEFQEYPKWVKTRRTDADGKSIMVIVNSKNEELKLIDEIVPIEELDSVQLERDLLAKNLDLAQQETRAKDEEIAKLKAQLEAQSKDSPEVKAVPAAKTGVKI